MSVTLRLARLEQAGKLSLLDERLIRLFAADDRASVDGCNWLNAVYDEAGSDLLVQISETTSGLVRWSLSVSGEQGAVLRLQNSQDVLHCEGEKGAERLVRMVSADGAVRHFEGEDGAERCVRAVFADGTVHHYEGDDGTARLVRVVSADGAVRHFEGERGAERCLRMVFANGAVRHYENL